MDVLRQPFVNLSRKTRLAIGEGLPGQAWKDRQPVWFGDVQNNDGFIRAAAAAESELTSGAGIPIVVGRKFKGVIEIYTKRKLTREPELLQLLGAVGNEIGQFIRQRRLTDTIRDEEARKSAILESALDCVITMDTAGRIVDFNPAAERTFGYAAADIAGQRLADTIIPKQYRQAHCDGLARFMSTGKSDMLGRRIELTAQRADGNLFPVELAINVSRGRDGSHFFTGYLRDITERKQAEAILVQRAELTALHASLAVSMAGEAPLNEILDKCCQKIVEGLDAAFARVWLLNETDQMLELTASAGMYTHLDGPHSRVPLGELKIGRIAGTQQPLLTNDVAHDPNIGDPEWAAREEMVAFAGYPLVVEHRTVGVIALFAKHALAPEVFEQLMPITDALAQCVARKESEQRLLDREQRLNLALDAGRLGTWHWDISADRVTWSDQLHEIFGYTKDQFNGTRAGFLDIIHPDDQQHVQERLHAVFTSNCRSYELDFRIIRGDGQRVIWTSGRGVIQRDELNCPLSMTAVASDITDRKHWELELTDRESHLRSVIDNTLFFIGVLDVDGTLLETNAVAINAAALDRSDVIGKKFWDCYWWNFDQKSINQLKEAVRRAATGEVVRYDVTVRMAADSRIAIDFMLSPVRASDGTITHLIPSGVDISERQAAEAAVIEREQFLTLALDAGKMGSFKWNIVTGQIEWSESVGAMFGCRQGQWDDIASSVWQLVHPDDREAVRTRIEEEFSSDADDHFVEFRLVRPIDGRIIWVEERGVIHRDEQGGPLQVTGLVQDISERKTDELNLAFLSDLQTQLVPLTSVDALMAVSTKLTANYLGLSRCLLVEFDQKGEFADILCDHYHGEGPTMVGMHSVSDFHDETERAALIAGQQVFSADTQNPDREDRLTESFRAFNIHAFCNSAYVTDRGTKFVVSALHAEKHAWQIEERRLLQEVADRVGIRIERARSEEELANREAHLRRVINNQLGLVGVIDRDGSLLEVDDRSLEIAKTRRDEVIGKHFAEAPWWNYDPAVAQRIREAMEQAFAGEVVRYDVSLFAHGNDGVMIDFMIAPVFDADGNVQYLIPSGVDIRERVKIEQEQRSVTRRMEMALRAGGMAAWEWTPTKSIWAPHLYELLGIDASLEANPELFFSLVHPDDVESLKESWQKAIDGSESYNSEFRIILPDHRVRWMNGVGEVVRDHDGKVVGMYGVNWDSTKDHLQAETLRESERRAHQANASKSEFLANMSHEIRTPMTAILGYADLLRDLIDNDEAKQHLQTIHRNGHYLLDIINDILDLSKIEAGKLDVEWERFEPYRLIEDVRIIMEVRAKEGGLKLDVEYDGMLPKIIQSDAKRLKQILINLVGNAIKFTRHGRVQIRVRFEASLRQLHFDVIDTGIGISDEHMEKLFKPFSQGDASVTRNFGGTGLGLVISQRLAEMLGGTIEASSTDGVGSTFTVSIVTGEIDESNLVDYGNMAADDGLAEATSDDKITRLSCHVLIVDDRRDIRFLSKRILTKSGATVDECEDGLIAVEFITASLADGNCPDLILLDMQMPNLDGYSTAEKLRTLGYHGPIIALTADAMQGDMNKCLEAGCNDYLSKPIDQTAMLRKVSEYLSGKT
jgi:PAS domain S-box-containing protein